jgi:hypothetical protein
VAAPPWPPLEPRFGNVDEPFESSVPLSVDDDVEEPDPLDVLDVEVWVPAFVSWRARSATATTPTTLTTANPAVTAVARVSPASRCMAASRHRLGCDDRDNRNRWNGVMKL